MIVSHQHKFIFLKTAKTAGTSVEIGLREFCGPDDIIAPISAVDEETSRNFGFRGPQNHTAPARFWRSSRRLFYNHQPADEVRRRLGRKIWRGYFKFTVERNPFDKAVSLYWWATRNEEVRPEIGDFLEKCAPRRLSNWPIYTINDEISVDRVIRFETLSDDLKEVGEMLGIGPIRLVRAKSSHRSDKRRYRDVLGRKEQKLIENVCRREIEAFDYEW